MAKRPSISSVGSGYTSPETLNQNFQNIAEAFDNTLSRDGSSPDQMESDLDMNSNDILNAKDVKVAGTLSVAGVDINDLLQGVGPGTVFNTTNRFSGTGSQTTFTLTKDPISRSNTMVYINGIYQQKDTYFLSGNDLVFSEAPPTGVDNIEVNIQESTETGVLEADVNLGVSSSPTETTITNTGGDNATIPSATPASSGVMSASDKTKLDGVEDKLDQAHYSTRASFVTDVSGGKSWAVGDVVTADGVDYLYDNTSTHLPSLTGWKEHGEPTPVHFGALGDGTTDDVAAFQSLVSYLSSDSIENAVSEGNRKQVNLLGRKYLFGSPLYIGRFDWNQDGAFEVDYGQIYGVEFTNGRIEADSAGTWVDKISGEIGKALVYVGTVTNVDGTTFGDGSGNMFEVMNIRFSNMEFGGAFKTGGVYVENTYRTTFFNCLFYDFGVGCVGVETSWQNNSKNPRGLIAKNQETVVANCRFEGDRRANGFDEAPGKVAFEGGNEIWEAQATVVGNMTLDGAHTSAGEYTSPTGESFFVEIRNAFDAAHGYPDFSQVNFTINGFADLAKTIPVSETMQGPFGGNKTRWSYSEKRYAVITSISCDTAVAGTNNLLTASSSYKTMGVRLKSNDFYVTNSNFTGCAKAMEIHGPAGQILGNHPWSRVIDVYSPSRLVLFEGNYFDFTDVVLWDTFDVQLVNNFTLGNANFIPVTTATNETFAGLLVVGNKFRGNSILETKVHSGGSIIAGNEQEYQIIGNSNEGTPTANHINGFTAWNAGGEFNGFLRVNAGGEFNGALNMVGNNFTSVRVCGLQEHSTEPTGPNGGIAMSDGTSSTNGFGTSGAGLYRKNGGTWTFIG